MSSDCSDLIRTTPPTIVNILCISGFHEDDHFKTVLLCRKLQNNAGSVIFRRFHALVAAHPSSDFHYFPWKANSVLHAAVPSEQPIYVAVPWTSSGPVPSLGLGPQVGSRIPDEIRKFRTGPGWTFTCLTTRCPCFVKTRRPGLRTLQPWCFWLSERSERKASY